MKRNKMNDWRKEIEYWRDIMLVEFDAMIKLWQDLQKEIKTW